MRSVAAIAAGYLVFALSAAALFALTGQDPHTAADPSFMLTSVMVGVIFAMIGGYLAGRIVPERPRRHAAAVGLLIAIGAFVSLAMSKPETATWSQFAAITIMAPSAALAGSLVKRRL
jgi:hypothetical protein